MDDFQPGLREAVNEGKNLTRRAKIIGDRLKRKTRPFRGPVDDKRNFVVLAWRGNSWYVPQCERIRNDILTELRLHTPELAQLIQDEGIPTFLNLNIQIGLAWGNHTIYLNYFLGHYARLPHLLFTEAEITSGVELDEEIEMYFCFHPDISNEVVEIGHFNINDRLVGGYMEEPIRKIREDILT